MKVTVLVPSYRRPEMLLACLRALDRQKRPPDETIVVLRDVDRESQDALAQHTPAGGGILRRVVVSTPGQMAALNAGLDAAAGEIICITDDDAQPLQDWVERIEARFATNPALGAVGGRDHVHIGGVRQPTRNVNVVGRIQWFGRSIGNHSQDSSGAREVDCLKGCNIAFRSSARPRFDERLRGDASQNEVGVCLALKAAGWRLLFDPEIRVNHFLGPRQFGMDRGGLTDERLFNNSYNHTLVRLANFPLWRRIAYIAYTFLVGDRESPGLARAAHLCRGHPTRTLAVVCPSFKGKLRAIVDTQRG